MPLGTDYDGQDCALARALEVVGERWTLLVLRDCPAGERRRLFVHVACDTEIDATGACPRCGTRPGPGDLEIRPGPALRHRRDDPVSRALREPHRMLTPLPG